MLGFTLALLWCFSPVLAGYLYDRHLEKKWAVMPSLLFKMSHDAQQAADAIKKMQLVLEKFDKKLPRYSRPITDTKEL